MQLVVTTATTSEASGVGAPLVGGALSDGYRDGTRNLASGGGMVESEVGRDKRAERKAKKALGGNTPDKEGRGVWRVMICERVGEGENEPTGASEACRKWSRWPVSWPTSKWLML